MALHYDMSKCKELDSLWDEEDEGMVSECLIFTTLLVGMNKITEVTVREFYARILLWESCFGTMLKRDGKRRPITYDEVKKRIGLETNASQSTWTDFCHKVQAKIYKMIDEGEV